jgi:hypothetical protein
LKFPLTATRHQSIVETILKIIKVKYTLFYVQRKDEFKFVYETLASFPKNRISFQRLVGNVEIETPRDRNGTFEPERQRTLAVNLERQILAYARGASYDGIHIGCPQVVRKDRPHLDQRWHNAGMLQRNYDQMPISKLARYYTCLPPEW